MSRQNYSYSTASTPRQVVPHSTSSAFSSSANPDEDWTKISDLAERRRIQNRIAQRNYRKKLKRRLEDLERRAGSSSASPPQSHTEIQQHQAQPATRGVESKPFRRSADFSHQQPAARMLHSQYTPPMDDGEMMFSQGSSTFGERDGSQTPPLFAYSGYPAHDEIIYQQPYSHPQQYRTMVTHAEYDAYLQPAPVTLPSMVHFHEAMKREDDHTTLGPYGLYNPGLLPSIDMQQQQAPAHHHYDSNPHTPPLSHSYNHSATCSENGYQQYPTTPLSMPPSPPLMTHL